ncbi:MAG: exo-alpha-sialidase [Bacteroidales bacterium]|nr:exo-alpha-sialidase [Bacteroidales bacterium]
MHTCISLIAGLCMMPLADTASPAVVTHEFIYETAPTPECHATTIAETRDGELIAAWFGGTKERNKDVGIWVAHKRAGKWTKPVEVANGIQADGNRHPCWNPVLFQPQSGPLMLFYKVGPSPSTWWGELRTSQDHGQTWSAATRLPKGILGPIKNKPIPLPDGAILLPTSSEHAGWRVHFERTNDLGKTYTATEPINDGKSISAIQPSILTRKDGSLLALGRSRQKKLWQAESRDGGKTWGEMTLTDLPNPNSGTDAVTLKDGRQLLVYNHTTRGRTPLNVAVSTDDGQTWKSAAVLETEPGEYSYPAVIQTRDGQVHITYTWKRKRVKHVVLDPHKFVLTDLPTTPGK